MHSLPKLSAEILALAKQVSQTEIWSRKSKSELNQPFKDKVSTFNFSGNATADIPSTDSSSSRPANIHGLNIIQFKDPTTPQTLAWEAALEIKDGRDVMRLMPVVEEIRDIVGDELPVTWVFLICSNIHNLFETSSSELDSPTDSILSSQSRMSLSDVFRTRWQFYEVSCIVQLQQYR